MARSIVARRVERTSKRVAAIAGRVLGEAKGCSRAWMAVAKSDVMSLAASALTQTEHYAEVVGGKGGSSPIKATSSALADALIESQLNLGFSLLKSTIKNEKSKARFRGVCLRIFRLLRDAFAEDEEFTA